MKKTAKADVEDFKVWCEYCSIRIAPNENRTPLDGKFYHERCYAKYSAAIAPVTATPARTRSVVGGKR